MHAVALYPVMPLRWLCALAGAWCACAQAQHDADLGGFAPSTAPSHTPSLSLELASRATPMLDDASSSRLSLTRWSGAAPQAGVGIGLGWAVPDNRMPGALPRTTAQRLDLGLNWRSAEVGQGRFQFGVWQRVSPTPDAMTLIQQANANGPNNYDTRLEMQFSAASSRGIRFELGGALGLQLNNNERVVLRVSRGKPMVYYRARF